MSVHSVCTSVQEGQKKFWNAGTGVRDSCESACGGRQSNLDPLEEQAVLLTNEASLQAHFFEVFSNGFTLSQKR